MERICDLHVHSTFSDGTLTPARLVRLAQELQISAVALCDHNTVAGLPEFLDAARGSALWAIPGIEFSTDYRGGELHILGLFIDASHYTAVTQRVEQMLQWKEQSNRDLVAGLKTAGIELDYDRIKAGTPGGTVNRAVIAAEMVRLGYCASVKEAFSNWLSEKHGYFHPPRRPDAMETITFIKSIGAVAVLAHPFLNLDEQDLRDFLPGAVDKGLDAMETYYPKFTDDQCLLAGRIAEEFGLLPSGGSDFHGANKPDIAMGTGRGNLMIPVSVADGLYEKRGAN